MTARSTRLFTKAESGWRASLFGRRPTNDRVLPSIHRRFSARPYIAGRLSCLSPVAISLIVWKLISYIRLAYRGSCRMERYADNAICNLVSFMNPLSLPHIELRQIEKNLQLRTRRCSMHPLRIDRATRFARWSLIFPARHFSCPERPWRISYHLSVIAFLAYIRSLPSVHVVSKFPKGIRVISRKCARGDN